jgi:hypothetical protein
MEIYDELFGAILIFPEFSELKGNDQMYAFFSEAFGYTGGDLLLRSE